MNANEISLEGQLPVESNSKISTFLRTIFFASAVTFGFIGILGYGITLAGVHLRCHFT